MRMYAEQEMDPAHTDSHSALHGRVLMLELEHLKLDNVDAVDPLMLNIQVFNNLIENLPPLLPRACISAESAMPNPAVLVSPSAFWQTSTHQLHTHTHTLSLSLACKYYKVAVIPFRSSVTQDWTDRI